MRKKIVDNVKNGVNCSAANELVVDNYDDEIYARALSDVMFCGG